MEIRILRYFLAVAEEQSFSRAAARLHLSQPALSQQLGAYEDEIGARLFVRSPKRIELTDKGRMLLRRARDIVELAARTEESLKANGDRDLSGSIVIGAGEVAAFGRLARAMKTLRAAHPKLNFRIISGNGEDWRAGLPTGRSTWRSSSALDATRNSTTKTSPTHIAGDFS